MAQALVKCQLTKCNVSISHPCSSPNLLIRNEPCDLFASEEIPDKSSLAGVVANDEPTGMSLARIVSLDPEDVLPVSCKATVDGQGVMMKAEDDISLCVEKVRGCRGTGIELPAFILRRDARIGHDCCRRRGRPS